MTITERKPFSDCPHNPTPGDHRAGTATSLLPCPFCGGEAERVDCDDPRNEGGSCISCTKCGASSAVHFDRKEGLLSSWNERTNDRTDQLSSLLRLVRELGHLGSHSAHWDRHGTHGVNCPVCTEQFELSEALSKAGF